MMAGRYTHAKQLKRHHHELGPLRTRFGRLMRDIGRKIAGRPALERYSLSRRLRARQILSTVT